MKKQTKRILPLLFLALLSGCSVKGPNKLEQTLTNKKFVEKNIQFSEMNKKYRYEIDFAKYLGSNNFDNWMKEGYLKNYPRGIHNPEEINSIALDAYLEHKANYYKYFETKNKEYAKKSLAEAEFFFTKNPNSPYAEPCLIRMNKLYNELEGTDNSKSLKLIK